MSTQPIPQRPPDDLPQVSTSADHFEWLGLPRSFDLGEDEIRVAYRRVASACHPDRFGDASDETIAKATRMSAAVNDAYRTLLDPTRRASYILTLCGGPSPEEIRDVPGNMLMEVMALREQIEEDKSAHRTDALAQHRQAVETGRAAALARIGVLARRIENAGNEDKATLRKELNAIRYYDNLLVELAPDPFATSTD